MKRLHVVRAFLIAIVPFAACTEDNFIESFYEATQPSPPRFVHPDKMENAIKVQPTGSSVRLNCRATGVPEPRVTWYKNSQPLSLSANRENGGSERRYSLHLTNLVRNDSGEYTCVVSNPLGSIRWTYTVEVHERFHPTPKIICPISNVTVTEGRNVSIRCDVYSHLTAFVRWIKHYHVDGRYFDRNGAPYAKLVKDAAVPDVTEPYILTLTNVTLADSGFYTILASSPSGASHKTVEVIVVPKPFPGL